MPCRLPSGAPSRRRSRGGRRLLRRLVSHPLDDRAHAFRIGLVHLAPEVQEVILHLKENPFGEYTPVGPLCGQRQSAVFSGAMSDQSRLRSPPRAGAIREVAAASFKLGLTSFGGPVAHIGYLHEEYVIRRGWIQEDAFADLVALCQVLPGPASSQVNMSIGMSHAGILGGLVAWLGFTLPSAVVM